MEILPITSTIDEPEKVEVPFVQQPESYADIAMLDSAEIAATFDALTALADSQASFEPEAPAPVALAEPEVVEEEEEVETVEEDDR